MIPSDLKSAQCQANFNVWCARMGSPPMEFLADKRATDRVFFHWTADWFDWCRERMELACIGIDAHRPWGVVSARRGWREKRPWLAVQIIQHQVDGVCYGEADVDASNPAQGVIPAIGHFFECWYHKVRKAITGPFYVADQFRKRDWDVPDVRRT